jgi:hypothetical protein
LFYQHQEKKSYYPQTYYLAQAMGSWLLIGSLGAFYPDYKGEGKPKYYNGYIPASFVWG